MMLDEFLHAIGLFSTILDNRYRKAKNKDGAMTPTCDSYNRFDMHPVFQN